MDAVRSAPELYAHAIAIEREATERYGELASRMKELGNPAVAELFGKLGAMEAEHLQTLERRTDGVRIPVLGVDQYRWLDAGAPETAARELVYRLMTPRAALLIALEAEKRAQDRALADRLGNYLFLKRTFAWDIDLEARIAALTPQQVNAALRRHIDPAKLSVIVAGDLTKN